jgi:hypothetical protein
MTNILKKMNSPRNFAAPAQFLVGMTRDQYAMQGGRDRNSFCNSLLEDTIFNKSIVRKADTSLQVKRAEQSTL